MKNEKSQYSGRKVVIYATCFSNYNNPEIGLAAMKVLSKNGVKTEVIYPNCCGMPQLEQGDISKVLEAARAVSLELKPWIEGDFDIITLIPSCALMMKFECPQIFATVGKIISFQSK